MSIYFDSLKFKARILMHFKLLKYVCIYTPKKKLPNMQSEYVLKIFIFFYLKYQNSKCTIIVMLHFKIKLYILLNTIKLNKYGVTQ